MASSRSIRFKVSVLLAIPLTSLVALWGFAATVTVGDSMKLLTIGTLYDSIGKPGGDLSRSVQREHLLSAEYLASRSDADRDTLAGQRMVTDQARARFQQEAGDPSAQSAMTAEMKLRFGELVSRVNELDEIRSKVDNGRIGLTGLSSEFARVPDAMNLLTNSMSLNNDLTLYHQSRTVTMISQAKDLLNRERALAAEALTLGRPLPSEELRLFTQFSTNRAFLMDQALPELESDLRVPFAELTASALYARFAGLENRLLSGGVVSATDWRSAATSWRPSTSGP
ncbi:nitrate- and nitrite sensing domain-containing protein [Streptosporangium lutulentum]